MARNGSRKGNGNGRSQPARHASKLPLPRMRRRRNGHSPLKRMMIIGLGSIVLIITLMIVGGGVAGVVAYNTVAGNLKPRLEALNDYKPFESSKIYDRNGVLLYEFFDSGRREAVPLDQISKYLIQATIATEDARFYDNPGVDYIGLARALYQNLITGETSGASTITQQVIKNLVLTAEEREPARKYERKVKEIILAQELNRGYTKDEILELYLNDNNYGNLAYGIQAASEIYFGVSASNLSLPQASLLAGLPQLPTLYNPVPYLDDNGVLAGLDLGRNWREPDYELPDSIPPAKARQVEVLRQMVAEGYISERQARDAAGQDLQFADQEFSLLAPHFVFYVREYLDLKYGPQLVNEGGLQITTTLDLGLQNIAQEEATKRIEELVVEQRNIHNAAVVVMQPNTGQILAMVGSVGYTQTKETTTPGEEGNVLDGKVNVTTRQRQPGSSIKPFAYLAGMEQNLRVAAGEADESFPGITPATILWDVDTRFPIRFDANERNINECKPEGEFWYCPKNYDLLWHGPMRPRMGLSNSLNMPAVKTLKRTGVSNMIDLLYRTGVAPTNLSLGPDHYGLSLTLGGGEVTPLDLATAYNTLASNGRYYAPNPILKITDSQGNTLEEFQQVNPGEPTSDTSACEQPTLEDYQLGARLAPGTQCVDARLTYIITKWISDNQARVPMFGVGSVISLDPPAAVKTGTTEDFRDAWASGFAPYVTITVWTGNNNNEQTAQVESTVGGGVIWARLMTRIRGDERIMALLGEPFGGQAPLRFPDSFPGVFARGVCTVPSNYNGSGQELFVEGFKDFRYFDAEEATEKTVSWSWIGGGLIRLPGCENANFTPPPRDETPTPSGSPTPDSATPTQGPTQPTEPPPPTQVTGPVMPGLVGYGENQARGILAGMGFTNIIVDYQSRSRLGPIFDQFPPYAVVAHTPPPGSALTPGQQIILAIRSPNDDQPPPPTAPPAVTMPGLVGYGENQAKEILAGMGFTNIIVDYQGRDRAGPAFDQFPPYAVIAHTPPAGSVLAPGEQIILAIRAPE